MWRRRRWRRRIGLGAAGVDAGIEAGVGAGLDAEHSGRAKAAARLERRVAGLSCGGGRRRSRLPNGDGVADVVDGYDGGVGFWLGLTLAGMTAR